MATEVTQATFDGLLASTPLLVVDFGAEWCGPCRALAPVIEELAEEYKDRITVATCDIEENNDISVRYSIRNIPTILFFRNGEVVDRHVGNIPRATLEEKFRALL
jgi:thioredoxin